MYYACCACERCEEQRSLLRPCNHCGGRCQERDTQFAYGRKREGFVMTGSCEQAIKCGASAAVHARGPREVNWVVSAPPN